MLLVFKQKACPCVGGEEEGINQTSSPDLFSYFSSHFLGEMTFIWYRITIREFVFPSNNFKNSKYIVYRVVELNVRIFTAPNREWVRRLYIRGALAALDAAYC